LSRANYDLKEIMILLIRSKPRSVYSITSLLMKLIKGYAHKKELYVDKIIDELKLMREDQDSPLWDQVLYHATQTQLFERKRLSKLRTSNQITYGTSARILVNHFKKNVSDAKILKDFFGKATFYGSEVCDVLCWTKGVEGRFGYECESLIIDVCF